MPRLQPFVVAGLVLLSGSAGAVVGDSETGALRLAQQRWTPLTGPLRDDGGDKSTPKVEPQPAPAAEPAAPPPSSSAGPSPEVRKVTLKATLASATTDSRTHGALGIRSFTVDRDLAQALGLGDGRGVLVTEVTRGRRRRGGAAASGRHPATDRCARNRFRMTIFSAGCEACRRTRRRISRSRGLARARRISGASFSRSRISARPRRQQVSRACFIWASFSRRMSARLRASISRRRKRVTFHR